MLTSGICPATRPAVGTSMERKFLIRVVALGVVVAALSGLAFAAPPPGPGGFNASGPAAPTTVQPDYLLGPFDKVSVTVFGQTDLSVKQTQIDAGGNVVLPLIGVVSAGGKTASQLSSQIEQMLGEKYLVSPHVSVLIDEAVSQRVTVTGAVVEPGVFNLKGRTSLMQAVAMAKGPDNKVANLRHVAVFREVEGRNARALFDLKAIEAGTNPDPEVFGGDSIIVESSEAKSFWREIIGALPALGVFAYF
jgi:polysaccharide export outer membrane protein